MPTKSKTKSKDLLTTAAEAIGSTLGSLVAMSGLAEPARRAPRKKRATAAASPRAAKKKAVHGRRVTTAKKTKSKPR